MIDRLLITGAAGRIGTVLRDGLADLAVHLRITDIEPIEPRHEREEATTVDLRDLDAVCALFDGVDAAIHLGAIPEEDTFERILDHNVRGTAHVYEAARRAGTRRVVFVSSNHATGMHPTDTPIGPDAAHRPDTFYGFSKCAGEDLGRLYHDKFGLEVVAIRIGTFASSPPDARARFTWLSHRDAVALFAAALTADVGFEVVYGLSGNTHAYWPVPRHLGYAPQDDAEAYAAEVGDDLGPGGQYQGGRFTLPEVTRFT